MRVAIYSRVSTSDKNQDPENQLIDLRAWCASQGFEVFREYTEFRSGSKGIEGRKVFAELFDDASKRKFGLVLFWALDRFSREGTYETISHLKVLADYGIDFHSYTEPFLCTDNEFAREILLSMLAALAKQERVRRSEQIKAGQKRATSKGKRIGRPKVTPYKLRRLKELVQSGLSQQKIAKELGIPRTTLLPYIKAL